MSLRSDCLLASTGLLPTGITPREHVASSGIPDMWAKRLKKWLTAEQADFRYTPPKDNLDKLFDKLATPPSQLEVEGWIHGLGIEDAELQAEYFGSITAARKLLVDAWPKLSIETPAGPQVLPLSYDDAEEVWSLWQILDDPDRVLEEMESWTLTPTQSTAFRTAYPDLFDHASQAIDAALIDARAKDDAFDVGWERDAVLRLFRGMPPEELVQPPQQPAPPPQKFKIDAERQKTQADISGAPKGAK